MATLTPSPSHPTHNPTLLFPRPHLSRTPPSTHLSPALLRHCRHQRRSIPATYRRKLTVPSTPRGSPCSTTPSYPRRSIARVRDPRLSLVARVSVGVALATQDTVLSGAPGRHGREDISLPLPLSHGDAAGLEGGAQASTGA